jgi:hypothetical protein
MYAQAPEIRRPAVLYNSFVVFCMIALLVFLLLASGQPGILRLLTGIREIPHLEWYALFLLFNLPSYPLEYVYLLRQKPNAIVWWGAFSFGFYLLALGVPVLCGYGLKPVLSQSRGWHWSSFCGHCGKSPVSGGIRPTGR